MRGDGLSPNLARFVRQVSSEFFESMAQPRQLQLQTGTADAEPRRSPRRSTVPTQQQKLRTLQCLTEKRTLPDDVPAGPWPSIVAATRALESHFGMKNMKAEPSQVSRPAANRGTQQPICCINESRRSSNGCRFHVVISRWSTAWRLYGRHGVPSSLTQKAAGS